MDKSIYTPAVGDYRVWYEYIPNNVETSVIGVVAGQNLIPHEENSSSLWVREGSYGVKEMIDEKKTGYFIIFVGVTIFIVIVGFIAACYNGEGLKKD